MPDSVRYRDFPIRIEPDGRGGFRAFSEGNRSELVSPWHIESIPKILRTMETAVRARDFRPKGKETRKKPPEKLKTLEQVGADLFQALFRGSLRDLYLYHLDSRTGQGLRTRLVFNPADGEALPLWALPWELLYWTELRKFLSLDPLSPVVRQLEVPLRTSPLEPGPGPLRVLVALASPKTLTPLGLKDEREKIEEAWRRQPGVELHFLEPARRADLRDALRATSAHVLHFIGHGAFEPSGEGLLVFEGPDRAADPMSGADLATALLGIQSLRLVVLNACDTARLPRRSGLDPYSGAASALVLKGIPAVVAMQFPISDPAAIAFSKGLYGSLALGDSIDTAVAEGRQKIHSDVPDGDEWATPVLFLGVQDLELVRGGAGTVGLLRSLVLDAREWIQDRTRGFVGRDTIFDRLDGFVQSRDQGCFLLRGDPGIGKSAFAAELVRRHGFVHHFYRQGHGTEARPQSFLTNVCAQLVLRYGLAHESLPPDAQQSPALLESLLGEVSRKLAPGEKALLVMDALDEADAPRDRYGKALLQLPTFLPPGIFLIATARRQEEILLPFRTDVDELEIHWDDPWNLDDLRTYVTGSLSRPKIRKYLRAQGVEGEAFVETMVAKSEGNFMFLRGVLPEIEAGFYAQHPLEEIPVGLAAYYEDHWRKMKSQDLETWFSVELPILAALTVSPEPASAALLAEYLDLRPPRVVAVLEKWDAFLHKTPEWTENTPVTRYSLYHSTFHEFLKGKGQVQAELPGIRERIGDYLYSSYKRSVGLGAG